MIKSTNILGTTLEPCCIDPMTGFFRTGVCETSANDPGSHTICAQMTAEFLEFSKCSGNDLSTPRPEFGFPGLKPGDRWCLCAARWKEALEAGKAPKVILASTNSESLSIVERHDLEAHAQDLDNLN